MVAPARFLATTFALSATVLLAAACEDPVRPAPSIDGAASSAQLGRMTGGVAVPFKAIFFTDQVQLGPDPDRCDLPTFFNVQEGVGVATHLGRFSIRITFCIDPTDILDDGQITEGESAPYSGEGTFVAANGDELHFTISGAVVPTDRPGFAYEFMDPFEITGGTGRFAGASGSGTTLSFVNPLADPTRTHHEWKAVLVRPRGN
jgi:hypothetical protein